MIPTAISRDGFRSLFEWTLAKNLTNRGVDFEYELKSLPYVIKHTYTPDFKLPNGIFIEAKGYFTGKDRTKAIAVKKQHPDIDIRFVFMNPHQRLSKKSKTTYGVWCEKHGFKWAKNEIPEEWIDE